ncbi:MAG: hypothetical protein GAK41_00665 [Burkholderia gladioli]|nr:MAG: hypothetical protein GAK41_00665 [Burkholderia gladioli]
MPARSRSSLASDSASTIASSEVGPLVTGAIAPTRCIAARALISPDGAGCSADQATTGSSNGVPALAAAGSAAATPADALASECEAAFAAASFEAFEAFEAFETFETCETCETCETFETFETFETLATRAAASSAAACRASHSALAQCAASKRLPSGTWMPTENDVRSATPCVSFSERISVATTLASASQRIPGE